MAGSFFCGDRVLRKIFCQARDDGFFGTLIRLRDQIDLTLIGDLRGPVELFAQDFARLLSNFDGSFEIVFSHEKNTQPRASAVTLTRQLLLHFTTSAVE